MVKVLLFCEVAWIAYFVYMIFPFMLYNSDTVGGIFYLRDDLIKMAFHIGAPVGMMQLLEHSKHVAIAPIFFIFFAVFTDLFSVLNIFYHLDSHVNYSTGAGFYVSCLKALSVWAIVMSGLSVVAYFILMSMHMWEHCSEKRKVYDPLLPQQQVPPQAAPAAAPIRTRLRFQL